MSEKCPRCDAPMKCLSGGSAHPDNWYCTHEQHCGYRRWTDDTRVERRRREMLNNSPLTKDTAKKFDTEKPRYDLLPPEMLDAVAEVMTFGAEKYGDRNWESGMDWSRMFGALQRHSWAWWAGEDLDPESGMNHLHHAMCCLAFLAAYNKRQVGNDDRPTKETTNGSSDH